MRVRVFEIAPRQALTHLRLQVGEVGVLLGQSPLQRAGVQPDFVRHRLDSETEQRGVARETAFNDCHQTLLLGQGAQSAFDALARLGVQCLIGPRQRCVQQRTVNIQRVFRGGKLDREPEEVLIGRGVFRRAVPKRSPSIGACSPSRRRPNFTTVAKVVSLNQGVGGSSTTLKCSTMLAPSMRSRRRRSSMGLTSSRTQSKTRNAARRFGLVDRKVSRSGR